ncbi:MAG: Trm112 family protein [Thermodesulfobacteriota bacterium]
MIDKKLLDIVVCPETKKALKFAENSLIKKINEMIELGKLKNRSDNLVDKKIDGGLITIEQTEYLYPIREEIPILLIEESIPLKQLK